MPQINYIPAGPREPTGLELTLDAFSKRDREIQRESSDADSLDKIYKQYMTDGQNIEGAIQALQKDPTLSPAKKVAEVNRLTKFSEFNQELQRKAKADSDRSAAIAARQPKVNQADRPIDPQQQENINLARQDPDFQKADPLGKYQIMTGKYNVSGPNAKNESDIASKNVPPYETESDKIDAKRTGSYIDKTLERGNAADQKMRGLNEGMGLLRQGATGAKLNNWLADYFDVPALADPKSKAFNAAMKSQYSGIGDIVKGKVSNFEFQTFQGMIADAADSPQAAELLLVSAMMENQISQKERDIVNELREQYYEKGQKVPPNFDILVKKQLQPYADLIMHETNQRMRNIINPTKKDNPNQQRLQEIFQ